MNKPKISQNLDSGSIICLSGELGSGKTTFARSLIRSIYFSLLISISPLFICLRPFPKLTELINLLKLLPEKIIETDIKIIENIGNKFFK